MRDIPSNNGSGELQHRSQGGGKRYFGRGGVKRALLGLLATEPMHGYQMIKALEEQSGGLYVPSAGSIYPTLQMLEDRELISSQSQEAPGTKKVYSITEAGLTILNELQNSHEHRHEHGRGHGHAGGHPRFMHGPEGEAYRHEKIRRKLGLSSDMYQVIRQLAAAEEQAEGNPVKKQELDRVVATLHEQLTSFLET